MSFRVGACSTRSGAGAAAGGGVPDPSPVQATAMKTPQHAAPAENRERSRPETAIDTGGANDGDDMSIRK
jgi:hypothetical protein